MRTGDFTGAQATSANVYTFNFSINDRFYSLDIRFPGSGNVSVGMADIVTGHLTFAAYFTYICHLRYTSFGTSLNVTCNLTELSYHSEGIKARDFLFKRKKFYIKGPYQGLKKAK